jgi:DNA-binding NtrC family response regulator
MLHSNSALKRESVIIIGASQDALEAARGLLSAEGFTNITLFDEQSVEKLHYINKGVIILVCRDAASKQELLSYFRQHFETPVIVAAETADTQTVIQIMRAGVFDMLSAPFDDRLAVSVIHALERRILMEALEFATGADKDTTLKNPDAFAAIITDDPKMKKIFSYMEQIASSSFPVLITGETGVGKELFAAALHKITGLNPFITLNIAGVDDNVFSDTLFGHRKGAFTGAEAEREGLLARAVGGMLFLDEIGDLPESSQIKLLRFLQEGTYYQLGSDAPQEVNTRIILATNKDLEEEVAKGRFRKDLYYRMRTHHLHIPPLRERMGDIAILVAHFAAKAAKQFHKATPQINAELINCLEQYTWPGNIRELEAMVNDAMARHKRGPLSSVSFQKLIGRQFIPSGSGENGDDAPFMTLKECEDAHVLKALEIAGGNQRAAAELLGITRQALNKRLLKKR